MESAVVQIPRLVAPVPVAVVGATAGLASSVGMLEEPPCPAALSPRVPWTPVNRVLGMSTWALDAMLQEDWVGSFFLLEIVAPTPVVLLLPKVLLSILVVNVPRHTSVHKADPAPRTGGFGRLA